MEASNNSCCSELHVAYSPIRIFFKGAENNRFSSRIWFQAPNPPNPNRIRSECRPNRTPIRTPTDFLADSEPAKPESCECRQGVHSHPGLPRARGAGHRQQPRIGGGVRGMFWGSQQAAASSAALLASLRLVCSRVVLYPLVSTWLCLFFCSKGGSVHTPGFLWFRSRFTRGTYSFWGEGEGNMSKACRFICPRGM